MADARLHVIIDGNNLMHAVYAHAKRSMAGREALVRMVGRWGAKRSGRVTIVFDGSAPGGGLVQQMGGEVSVRFSGNLTADDVIIEMIHKSSQPSQLEIVSSDGAITYEARYRKCRVCDSGSFVGRIDRGAGRGSGSHGSSPADASPGDSDSKPTPSDLDTDQWLAEFDLDDLDLPDDDAMPL